VWSPAITFITSFVTVFATVIAITKDLPDTEGDRLNGISTFATQLGVRTMSLLVRRPALASPAQPLTLPSGGGPAAGQLRHGGPRCASASEPLPRARHGAGPPGARCGAHLAGCRPGEGALLCGGHPGLLSLHMGALLLRVRAAALHLTVEAVRKLLASLLASKRANIGRRSRVFFDEATRRRFDYSSRSIERSKSLQLRTFDSIIVLAAAVSMRLSLTSTTIVRSLPQAWLFAARTASHEARSVDPQETAKFEADAGSWWDVAGGPFAPLHAMNPTRCSFLRDALCRQFDRDPCSPDPLAGLRLVDVGCGGGILCACG